MEIKEALKKDFRNLYVKDFTTDWEAQRLVRETEIDVMSFKNLDTLIHKCEVEAVREFAVWFENNTGGLFRGEMEQKYKDYLSEKG